jgi:hypothetical protein
MQWHCSQIQHCSMLYWSNNTAIGDICVASFHCICFRYEGIIWFNNILVRVIIRRYSKIRKNTKNWRSENGNSVEIISIVIGTENVQIRFLIRLPDNDAKLAKQIPLFRFWAKQPKPQRRRHRIFEGQIDKKVLDKEDLLTELQKKQKRISSEKKNYIYK